MEKMDNILSTSWANRPLAGKMNQILHITDFNILVIWDVVNLKWKPLGGRAVIYRDVTYSSVTANGASQIIKNYLIPGGLLSRNGGLFINAKALHTGTAGTKIFQWRFSNTPNDVSGGFYIVNSSMGAVAATLSQGAEHYLYNDNSLTAQISDNTGTTAQSFASSSGMITGAINTAIDSYVCLALQGTASDTIGYRSVLIEWIEQ